MSTRVVTVSELKTKLGDLMAELEQEGVPLYVTQRGKPKAVLVRYADYEALLKKVDDLEDILAMKEALSTTESESITLHEYEQQATSARGH